uniref:CNNM transmembrane domain-containing protein n=1 Tax=Rodentolepis nana TaxID=102285 RepID=A0A0R3TR97_RODNA
LTDKRRECLLKLAESICWTANEPVLSSGHNTHKLFIFGQFFMIIISGVAIFADGVLLALCSVNADVGVEKQRDFL